MHAVLVDEDFCWGGHASLSGLPVIDRHDSNGSVAMVGLRDA